MPIAAVELNVIYLLRMAEGNGYVAGKIPLHDVSWTRWVLPERNSSLHIFILSMSRTYRLQTEKLEIMISNHNPEDDDIYRGNGFARLPMN